MLFFQSIKSAIVQIDIVVNGVNINDVNSFRFFMQILGGKKKKRRNQKKKKS